MRGDNICSRCGDDMERVSKVTVTVTLEDGRTDTKKKPQQNVWRCVTCNFEEPAE